MRSVHIFILISLFSMQVFAFDISLDSIRGSVGVAQSTNAVDGKGFVANQNSNTGYNYTFGMTDVNPDYNSKWDLEYSKSQNEYEVPSGLSPNKVSTVKTEYKISYYFPSESEECLYCFSFGIGYKIQSYSSDLTTPNNVISNREAQGVEFHLLKVLFENESKSKLFFNFSLFLPHKLQETSSTTGFGQNMFSTAFLLLYSYGLTDQACVYSGIKYEYERASFSGAGTRGTLDANDIRTMFLVPFGLEYSF